MAKGRPVDRDQQFLLPVDMREWLPDDHVVWVLLEVVDHLDLRGRRGRRPRGCPWRGASVENVGGRAQVNPVLGQGRGTSAIRLRLR
jgi:hypothetical protein